MRTGTLIIAACLILLACAFAYEAFTNTSVIDIKSVDMCEGVTVLAWSTNKDCRCDIMFCSNDFCIHTDTEPEIGKLHVILLPSDAMYIQIMSNGNVLYKIDSLK